MTRVKQAVNPVIRELLPLALGVGGAAAVDSYIKSKSESLGGVPDTTRHAFDAGIGLTGYGLARHALGGGLLPSVLSSVIGLKLALSAKKDQARVINSKNEEILRHNINEQLKNRSVGDLW